MTTLLLDLNTWDLTLDSAANVAMASDPYAMAQDVASACRTFLGELWYQSAVGIPYFQRILGKLPPAGFIKAQEVAAALSVPGVATAKCFLTSFVHRQLAGQVQITTQTGATLVVGSIDMQNVPWYVSGVSLEAAS